MNFRPLRPHSAALVRVPAVVADQMGSLRWDVLGELRQKIERRKDLTVPLVARLHAISILVRKGPARLLLRLVDHLTRFGHLDQSGQTKGAPGYVLDQTLDPPLIAGR